MTEAQQYIWDRVIPEPNSGCWLWQLSVNNDGYGTLTYRAAGGRTRKAHRVSYMTFYGSIPDGFQIDHLCRVRCCVNPSHLEAVPKKVNDHRSMSFAGINARKTHCASGHPFAGDNLQIGPDGRRNCRGCACFRAAAYRRRKLEAA